MPDKKPRNELVVKSLPWWPARKVEAYSSEPFYAWLTDGEKTGSLNGAGMVRFDGIPAGTCGFRFHKFYDEIDQFFKKELR